MKTGFLLLAVLTVSGCGEIEKIGKTECGDEAGLQLVTEIVSDEATKQLAQEKNSDGARLFDASAIRAQLSVIKLAVTEIRTDKTDPNSTKVFCKGSFKVTLPAESLATVDEDLKSLNQGSLSALADQSDMERNANVFTSDISYTLQPTDDKKSIYAEVGDGHQASDFLRWVVGSQIVASMRASANASKSIAASIPEEPVEPEVDEVIPRDQVETAASIHASFPCEAASTTIEKAICSDADLAGLDKSVGELYQAALRAYPQADVRNLQLSWLQDVRNQCTSITCLQSALEDRRDFFAENYPTGE